MDVLPREAFLGSSEEVHLLRVLSLRGCTLIDDYFQQTLYWKLWGFMQNINSGGNCLLYKHIRP